MSLRVPTPSREDPNKPGQSDVTLCPLPSAPSPTALSPLFWGRALEMFIARLERIALNLRKSLAGNLHQTLAGATKRTGLDSAWVKKRDPPQPVYRSRLTEITELPSHHLIGVGAYWYSAAGGWAIAASKPSRC